MDKLPEPKIKKKYEIIKSVNVEKLKKEKYLDALLNKEFIKDYFKDLN